FINYRRLDTEGYVGRLYDHLLKEFKPTDIFMDVQNIEPGADFVQVLEDAIAACDIFLAMIGPHWGKLYNEAGERRLEEWNDFVRIEIETALKQGKIVVPILVGGSQMPNPSTLPESIMSLSRRNAFTLTHYRFAEDVESLVQFLRGLIPTHPTFKRRAAPDVIARKEKALKDLRLDLLNAKESPLYAYRTEQRYYPVLGEGYADANIMIVGESPGKQEAETGKPFIGPSGEVLDSLLDVIELSRADVWLTNILLDRAPDNRDPNKEELDYYGVYLDKMIEIVDPRVIVTLGRFSMTYILRKFNLPEKTQTISKLHGKLIQIEAENINLHIMPMYHPAMVLYNPSKRDVLRQDMQRLEMFT
ncbi:MAG: uracil-DNA glycosylase family protein, partial [Chloroflexota bacterium]